jgi:hypothetical protein
MKHLGKKPLIEYTGTPAAVHYRLSLLELANELDFLCRRTINHKIDQDCDICRIAKDARLSAGEKK